jgi:error-prone DNA polymerase
MVIDGEVQRSKEGVVHLMVRQVTDATAALSRLSQDVPIVPQLSRSDAVRHPAYPRHGHPRNVRILPRSRDFH